MLLSSIRMLKSNSMIGQSDEEMPKEANVIIVGEGLDPQGTTIGGHRDHVNSSLGAVEIPEAFNPNQIQVVDYLPSTLSAPETSVLSPKMQKIIDSMTDVNARAHFLRSCEEVHREAFNQMVSPQLVEDSRYPNEFTVVDTGPTVKHKDFAATVADLFDKGLELWDAELFLQLQENGWSWVLPGVGRVMKQGRALYGNCVDGNANLCDRDARDSDPFLLGRGLRRVRKVA